jgi:TatD DNase family protein
VSMNLVDFHCHLDLYQDHEAAILECEQKGVQTLTVTTTPRAWPRNRSLTQNTLFVRAALGLHPQLIEERASEIQIWETYLSQTRYIGEVGLDAGPRFYRSFDLQKKIFEKILKLCNQAGGKILTVHSVRTPKTVLNMIEKYFSLGHGRVILHWFTGSKAEAKRAVELGCYFSVNAEMLRNEHHSGMVRTLPVNRILTETDGPFCKYQSRPIKPTDVINAVNLLANLFSKEPSELAQMIASNLKDLEAF